MPLRYFFEPPRREGAKSESPLSAFVSSWFNSFRVITEYRRIFNWHFCTNFLNREDAKALRVNYRFASNSCNSYHLCNRYKKNGARIEIQPRF